MNQLTKKRTPTGRPPGSSRLSTATARLSTVSTLPPDSPGAAFTPKKK